MSTPRSLLCLFKPKTRITQVLVEELHRCWAKLDGRAETIRRLIESRGLAREAVGNALGECGRLRTENGSLRVELQAMRSSWEIAEHENRKLKELLQDPKAPWNNS